MTLRKLQWMADGRLSATWTQVSYILAQHANANRDPKKSKRITPAECNAYEISKRRRRGRDDEKPYLVVPIRDMEHFFRRLSGQDARKHAISKEQ